MEHISIIKNFAKFPLKAGVLKNFKATDINVDGYSDLAAYFEAMDPHSLIPEIEEFIVTQNDKTLSDKVHSVKGWFMLLETSGIAVGAMNDARVRDSKIAVQVTIAHHWDGRSLNAMGEALLSDKALSLQNQLIGLLKSDDKEQCANKRWLDDPYQLDTVEPLLLFESIGWQLTLTRNYTSLL